jgi:hypothetical protein
MLRFRSRRAFTYLWGEVDYTTFAATSSRSFFAVVI